MFLCKGDMYVECCKLFLVKTFFPFVINALFPNGLTPFADHLVSLQNLSIMELI